MKKTVITMGDNTYVMTHGSFVNKAYKPEWKKFVPGTNNTVRYCEGTFGSDDGVDFAIYDGGTNYVGRVNKETGEMKPNTDTEYDKSFVEAAKAVICK